ncbi:NAD(P)-binding protein [Pholiota conissans]|uniref:NAD(P)-binding protein n=1 Tax=Pholiota conissans TaxID=109636 RepID=A0A9P5YWY2_9AGAR|nr:NAD(P)-binding protein [Pholiota conissans]
MSDSTAKVYFVAGATRGIGLALVGAIVSKDTSAKVYAGGRDPLGSKQLVDLAAKYPGRIEPVKYVAGDQEGNTALAAQIQKKHGHIDTIIANAAIGTSTGKVHENSVQNYEEHFSINVVGPIVLFQAFRDLLKASFLPRFIAISSMGGSIEALTQVRVDNAPYGVSKAALNWIIRKIHYENDWLVTFPQCPGAVDTDMLRRGVANDATGIMKEMLKAITLRQPDDVANSLVDIFAASTREKDGGQFHNIDGGRWPW